MSLVENDDHEIADEPKEPECFGSCANCGCDIYDDEPCYLAELCDQCAWWAEQE